MILNFKGRQDVRNKIGEKIEQSAQEKYPINNPEDLEWLLFETQTYTIETTEDGKEATKKIQVKYLVWQGPFLKKLDLSGVSFDDVCLDAGVGSIYKEKYGIDQIDLSGTNAKINLKKTQVEPTREGIRAIRIENCNLEGCDLSESPIDLNGSERIFVVNSNLKGTKLKLIHNPLQTENKFNFWFERANFSDCQLDEFGFRVSDLLKDYTYSHSYIKSCNFERSGLSVIDDTCDYKKKMVAGYKRETRKLRAEKKLDFYKDPETVPSAAQSDVKNHFLSFRALALLIKYGYLGGCTVLDVKLLTKQQKAEKKKSDKRAYEEFARKEKAKKIARF